MNARQRVLWIIAIALAVLVMGLLSGCANTPVPRSTDTPAYSMRDGQTVTIKFMPPDVIATFARANIDAAYRVDAVAFPGDPCVVWMQPGPLDLYLLNHEMARCAGLRHDREGRWN